MSFIRPIKVIVQHDPIHPVAKFIILRSISLFGKGLEKNSSSEFKIFIFWKKIIAVQKETLETLFRWRNPSVLHAPP